MHSFSVMVICLEPIAECAVWRIFAWHESFCLNLNPESCCFCLSALTFTIFQQDWLDWLFSSPCRVGQCERTGYQSNQSCRRPIQSILWLSEISWKWNNIPGRLIGLLSSPHTNIVKVETAFRHDWLNWTGTGEVSSPVHVGQCARPGYQSN